MEWFFLLLCAIATAFAVRAYLVMLDAEHYREKWRRRATGLNETLYHPWLTPGSEELTTGELRRRFDGEGKFR